MISAKFSIRYLSLVFAWVSIPAFAAQSSKTKTDLQEVRIWGKSLRAADAGYTSPTSILTKEDMEAINVATTEDLVKFEPSLVIRRRFIGDSNGTIGVRGSNMFQTPRSMVFADGVPLHYFLETRWSGAPRWTMVSASEIAQVEVIYGPFSAEYSGNAMGGVVRIETAIPQEQELHIDGSFFSQDFDAYGYSDQLDGYKGFISYGNKTGQFSYYLSYNHLDNTAQPQTFRDSSYSEDTNNNGDTARGGIFDNNSVGTSRIWYGDTGVVDTTTDNYKVKLGYEWDSWLALLNVAFEDRESNSDSANSYIEDENGNTLWSGNALIQDGQTFSFDSSRLNESELNRQSLSMGLRVKGDLSQHTHLETNINQFSILEDETLTSEFNPNDPAYTSAGQIADYHDSGWFTADIKLSFDQFFSPDVEFLTGVRTEHYELNQDIYDSPNYQAGIKGDFVSRFGGKTSLSALYAQTNWQINSQWNTAFGLRYESYKSSGGYYSSEDDTTQELVLVDIPSNSDSQISPKFSIGYQANPKWLFRYSVAKAYRFPIAEELFSQYEDYNTVSIANPNLNPEDGLHNNLMIDRAFDGGYIRFNIFHETVKDAIEAQTDTINNVRSFVPIDKVATYGVEWIVNKHGFLMEKLDVRFNLTWTQAEIIDNSTAEANNNNPGESIEGNTFPRMPEWRSNLLATYYLHTRWNVSANLQYASDSYGRLDNTDNENNVYGAQDEYTRIGVKTDYQLTDQWQISAGVDNLTNEISYVAHPWPGRTFYLNFSFDL